MLAQRRRGTQRTTPKASRRSAVSWHTGDATFESPSKKDLRAALRHDSRISAALDAWWDATDTDKSGSIDRDEYIELSKALYRVMIGDGNETAAQSSAEDDWEEDCKGESEMDGAHFRDAIFMLSDLWTESLDPDEYVAFLNHLLTQMKAAGLGSLMFGSTSRVPPRRRQRAVSLDENSLISLGTPLRRPMAANRLEEEPALDVFNFVNAPTVAASASASAVKLIAQPSMHDQSPRRIEDPPLHMKEAFASAHDPSVDNHDSIVTADPKPTSAEDIHLPHALEIVPLPRAVEIVAFAEDVSKHPRPTRLHGRRAEALHGRSVEARLPFGEDANGTAAVAQKVPPPAGDNPRGQGARQVRVHADVAAVTHRGHSKVGSELATLTERRAAVHAERANARPQTSECRAPQTARAVLMDLSTRGDVANPAGVSGRRGSVTARGLTRPSGERTTKNWETIRTYAPAATVKVEVEDPSLLFFGNLPIRGGVGEGFIGRGRVVRVDPMQQLLCDLKGIQSRLKVR